jgi:hypothetical protein
VPAARLPLSGGGGDTIRGTPRRITETAATSEAQMNKVLLDVDSIRVETFTPQPALPKFSGTQLCTRYDTCTNCPQVDTCIC